MVSSYDQTMTFISEKIYIKKRGVWGPDLKLKWSITLYKIDNGRQKLELMDFMAVKASHELARCRFSGPGKQLTDLTLHRKPDDRHFRKQ